ncbi:MAG: methyltransferase domain-containing protein [Myxococcaceae bacterium]|nr:methyltransferase domain-containing protein [Myxococcaceae bacterium]
MVLRRLRTEVPELPSAVELFGLFSEPARLQVLALAAEEELSIGELATLLKDSQPQVSRKVSALKAAQVVAVRRDGRRVLVKLEKSARGSAVVDTAITEGRRLCLSDGSLARLPAVLARREDSGLEVFSAKAPSRTVPALPEHLAHLSSLAPLLPGRALAIDVGTGDGLMLDLLAPLFERVIAVDRSRAQLAKVQGLVAARGFHQVSLFEGSYDDAALLERIDRAGGADLVFAGRTLHHAARPAVAVQAFARMLRPGGHLVVLDYLPHQDEALRTEGGDVWQGFAPDELRGFLEGAGLTVLSDRPIPSQWHPLGPDARVQWHVWAALKPLPPVLELKR